MVSPCQQQLTATNQNNDVQKNPQEIQKSLAQDPTAKQYRGVKRTKSSKWVAEIQDPISKKRIWLGSFETPEEASRVYLSKQLEFEAKSKLKSSYESSPSRFKMKTWWQNPTAKRYTGVRMRRPGKWTAEIKDPFTRKGIWLGTFKNPEEASRAYLSKKLEFEVQSKMKSSNKTKEGLPPKMKSSYEIEEVLPRKMKSTQEIKEGLPPKMKSSYEIEEGLPPKMKSTHEIKEGLSPKMKSSYEIKEGLGQTPEAEQYKGVENGRRKLVKWSAENRNPFNKISFWLGTFDSAEEAYKGFISKRPITQPTSEFSFESPSSVLKIAFSPSLSGTNKINGNDNVMEVVKEEVRIEGLFGSNVHKYPEEIEMILVQKTQNPTTKRYKGIWRRKSGKWVARTRDPLNNVRVLLGTFDTAAEAFKAYLSKRLEFEAQLTASVVANESKSETLNEYPSSVLEIKNSGSPNCSTEAINGDSMEVVTEDGHIECLLIGQFWPDSCGKDSSFGLNFGSLIIDSNGFLLGEFSQLDNLQIEDGAKAHRIC